MKNKYFTLLIVISVCICYGMSMLMVQEYYSEKNDITVINQIVTEVKRNKDDIEELENSRFEYNFSVVYQDGTGFYTTKDVRQKSYQEFVNEAIRNHETVMYFDEGAIVIYTNEFMETQRGEITAMFAVFFVAFMVIVVIHYFYYRNRLIQPFERLKEFASLVSVGQFDLPLPMDKGNMFGAFSESFDLLRHELGAAQKRAIELEKSKNEMVASLSHDVKTPLSSIIAVSDILLFTETDPKKQTKLKGISAKAEEIDNLITNLFQTTLEDLSELPVNVQSYSTDKLLEMIGYADALEMVVYTNEMPSCLVEMDPLRMGQVLTNILSNSYKYANTPVEISFRITNESLTMLEIQIQDFGHSMKISEIHLLASKFYRGSNVGSQKGSGLGLYNCRHFLERMGGKMTFIQNKKGFCVRIYLRLS